MGDCGADVIVVPETHADDELTMKCAAAAVGLRYCGGAARARPLEGARHPASGGVGLFARADSPLKASLVAAHPSGGGVVVEVRARGAAPLAVICLYVPPHSSTHAAEREPLLQWHAGIVDFLRAPHRYRDSVVVAGDFNTQIGTLSGRHVDPRAATASPGARSLVQAWSSRGMAPAHGRSEATRAHLTSAAVATARGTQFELAAEVDYIVTPRSRTDVEPRPMLELTPGEPPPPHGCSHWPVTVRIPLLPLATASPEASAAPRRAAPVNLPPYANAAAWAAVFDDIGEALAPLPDGADLDAIERVLLEVQARHAVTHAPMPMPDDAETWALVTAALDAVPRTASHAEVDAAIDAAVRARPPKRQCTTVYRRYGGHALPPHLTSRMRATRRAYARARSLPVGPERSAALAAVMRMNAVTRAAARRGVADGLDAIVARLAALRASEPHRATVELKRLLPDDWRVHGAGPALDPQRLHASFSAAAAEHRPTPRGATSEEALRHVLRARETPADSHLADPFTPAEVLAVIAPPGPDLPPLCHTVPADALLPPGPGLATRPHAECSLCERTKELRARAATHGTPLPTTPPTLATSKAAGPGGLKAELLRWARVGDAGATREGRATLARRIADALNAVLRTGTIPDVFRDHTTTALPRKACGDPADPDNYRGITVANVLDKVADAIIARRLQHWAHRNGLLGREQIGFAADHGAEQHVGTVHEALRWRHAAGLDTYLLFLDLRKAYDRVHHDAMWRVLSHMGAPSGLTDLLRAWAAARVTRVACGGRLSAEYPMQAGVPQGGVTSPILFNLFIESLSHTLRTLPTFHGVDVAGLLLRHLLYADDVVVLCESPAQAQVVADAVSAWCATWGMDANIGGGKTEVMRVAADGRACADDASLPPVVWAPVPTDGVPAPRAITIPWVDCYRYLGFRVMSTISASASAFTAQQRATMTTAHDRYFAHSPLRHNMSVAHQLQLLSTCVLSTTTYLRGVILRTETECASLDALVLGYARDIFGVPVAVTNALVWALSGLVPAWVLQARMRERVAHHARLPNGDASIFAELLRHIEAFDTCRSSLTRRQVEQRKRELAEPGMTDLACNPIVAVNVSLDAALYAARMGVVFIRKETRTARGADSESARPGMRRVAPTRPPFDFLARPGTLPSDAVVSALSGVTTQPSDIDAPRPAVPLSAVIRGSLAAMALTPRHDVLAIAAIASGPLALNLYPFSHRGRRRATTVETAAGEPAGPDAAPTPAAANATADGDLIDGTRPRASFPAACSGRSCRLCSGPNEDVFHLAFECKHAYMVRVQAHLPTTARRMLDALVRMAHVVVTTGEASPLRGEAAHLDALPDALASCDTAEARAVVFRLLCGFPFPARAVNVAAAPHANLVGRVWDACKQQTASFRVLATTVVRASARYIRKLAAAWNCAMWFAGHGGEHERLQAPAGAPNYHSGGTITGASMPHDLVPRWRGAHNDVCGKCDDAGSLILCELCNVAWHGQCRPDDDRAVDVAALDGLDWLCPACAVEAAALADAVSLHVPLAAPRAVARARRLRVLLRAHVSPIVSSAPSDDEN
jgi:hypothetical protein